MDTHDNQYNTLTEAVKDLEARGYIDEISLTEDGLSMRTQPLDPARFIIDSFHRFEGPSDPGDLSIIYAISSPELGLKGLLIGDYGPNAQNLIHKMVRKLEAHHGEGVQPVHAAAPGENVKR